MSSLILGLYYIFTFLENISNIICTHLTKSYGNKQIKLIEVNPGPCLITQNILKKTDYNILIYENSYNAFKEYLTVSFMFVYHDILKYFMSIIVN